MQKQNWKKCRREWGEIEEKLGTEVGEDEVIMKKKWGGGNEKCYSTI